MNRLGIVILVVLCLISSYAFSQSSELVFKKIKPGNVVEFAWDEVTNNSKDYVIGYIFYRTEDNPFKGVRWELDRTFKLQTAISFAFSSGIHYVGVSSALFKDTNLKSEPIRESKTCWSYDGDCTNNNPFVLKVEN